MRQTGMSQVFSSTEELCENCSSFIVAVFEVVFATRIADIKRRPATSEEYAHNAQRVVDSLRAVLPARVTVPKSLTGISLARGELPAVAFVVGLFRDILRVVRPAGREGEPEEGDKSTSDSTAMATLRKQLSGVQSPAKKGAEGGAQSAKKGAAPPPVPPPKVSEPEPSGQGGAIAAKLAEVEARRAQAAAAAVTRNQSYVMKRLAHKNEEELAHIRTMLDGVVKAKDADRRVLEANAVRAATTRAKSAKQERKVLALRTRRILDDMTRHTLSLRIARSSHQAAAASSLLKAVAAQQRLAGAEKIKMAAAESEQQVLGAQARIAWMNHAAKATQEAIMEEQHKQVAQRMAAARSQKEALQRALSEMKSDEQALLAAMKAEQAHAEAVFLAHSVEPMDLGGPMGGGASRDAGLGATDGVRLAADIVANELDTDASTQRVDTLRRVQAHLGKREAVRAGHMAATQGIVDDIARSTGSALADAEIVMAEAQVQVEASRTTLRGLAGPRKK
jgi:hypothetical protein